jgi:hypothetical protein
MTLAPTDVDYFRGFVGLLDKYGKLLLEVGTIAGLDTKTLSEIVTTPLGDTGMGERAVGFNGMVARAVADGAIPDEVRRRHLEVVADLRRVMHHVGDRHFDREEDGLFQRLGRVKDYYERLAGDLL